MKYLSVMKGASKKNLSTFGFLDFLENMMDPFSPSERLPNTAALNECDIFLSKIK